jgi:ATP-dependent DNA helicase, RecQ family
LNSIFDESVEILKKLYGQEATFRQGQYEAIEATLTHLRTLVVQKTGWGKSLVYFISTKINRQRKKGVTFIVSPLLVLMDNQIEAGKKLGLNCGVLNSTIKEKAIRSSILEDLLTDKYDIFFITPESLFGKEFQEVVSQIDIGLFVIDECHCISDWGHDFRLEYGNLYKIIKLLPNNVSVLGTTATANNRVIEDLKKQLGETVFVSRGELTRKSLNIEVVRASSKAERYAWIKKNLPKLPGAGIIYCLTQRDCNQLSEYLNMSGIESMPYYSNSKIEEQNKIAENKLMNNEIKVLVSTVKLGMGYDKPDISFVIHFQQPGSIISYYQQIGRAGRNIPNAFCYLMTGQEDDAILNYFIENAFPTENQARLIIDKLQNSNGLSINLLETYCNMKRNKVIQFLAFLENEGFTYKNGSKYYRSAKPYQYNGEHYNEIKDIKYCEKATMQEYIATQDCLSNYIVNALDDLSTEKCGKCYNCLGRGVFPEVAYPDSSEVSYAQEYLDSKFIEITPRKQWPDSNMGLDDSRVISFKNDSGLALAKYGDSGFGEMVAHDKYRADSYRNELIEKSISLLKDYIEKYGIVAITVVPSNRTKKVNNFAEEVAKKLKVKYVELFDKQTAPQQKEMENSYHQAMNIIESVRLKSEILVPSRIVIIDDIVDSKWTLTVCGWLLKKSGAEVVFPYCLADSSEKGGYN